MPQTVPNNPIYGLTEAAVERKGSLLENSSSHLEIVISKIFLI